MRMRFRSWQRDEELADWLPWLLPIDGELDTILTSGGGLLRAAQLRLPDFETASPEALIAHHHRIASALAKFGNGWSIWLDQWRKLAPAYLPECDFGGNHAAKVVDASRREHFTAENRPVFANTAFIAVHYVPQQRDAFLAWLMERQDGQVQANIAFFRENTDALFAELGCTLRGIEVLHGDTLASYLAASVTYKPGRVRFPSGVIRQGLAASEWYTSGTLRIDDRHLATVEVRNFGSPSPLTVESLHELPFECRWVATLHGLDHDTRRKEILEVRKRWQTKQKGPGAILTEIVTRNPYAGRTDPEVNNALASLDLLQGDLASRPFALAHANVHVWGTTRDEAQERAGTVMSLLNAQGLLTRVATLNNVFAPLADMPGNVTQETANVRRSREDIRAITRLAPVTGVLTGSTTDWRFGGPALMVGKTRRGVSLYWSMNASGSDSAHTALVGHTGAGKSAFIAFMAMQFLRYSAARVVVFDRGRSFKVPCLALGGDWIELGGGGHGVQPLRAIDDPSEFAWAQRWVINALLMQGMALQPHTDEAITTALRHVAELPPDARTLTCLHTYLGGDDSARRALRSYLAAGPYGQLLDGVVASYGSQPVMGIETSDVIRLEGIAPLVISAMFRAVRRERLTGDMPKLIVVDEAWSLMGHQLFAKEIESWARELRKLKAALVLATQSLQDLATEGAKVIFDQMGNRIYLPHAEAMRPQSMELYLRAGLQEDQIRVLAQAQAKAEYLLQTDELTRLIQVRLEDDALALCGSSSPLDHLRADTLLAEGVAPGEEFTRRWLAQTTAQWQAQRPAAQLVAA